jgi:hypothetical protein
MDKKCIILPLMLVFLLAAPSWAQEDAGNESSNLTNETAPSVLNLNYIWSVSGIEAGPISMAVDQDGSDLFIRAKYEPEGEKAWNAEGTGSVDGDQVELSMTAQKEDKMVTTKMTGTYANDTINGNFTQTSGGQKIGGGQFTAMWISPGTSSYAPAVVEEEVKEPAASVDTTSSTESASDTQETKDNYYKDVREWKDKIGPGGDLSGVPPGMGGSGLN